MLFHLCPWNAPLTQICFIPHVILKAALVESFERKRYHHFKVTDMCVLDIDNKEYSNCQRVANCNL